MVGEKEGVACVDKSVSYVCDNRIQSSVHPSTLPRYQSTNHSIKESIQTTNLSSPFHKTSENMNTHRYALALSSTVCSTMSVLCEDLLRVSSEFQLLAMFGVPCMRVFVVCGERGT